MAAFIGGCTLCDETVVVHAAHAPEHALCASCKRLGAAEIIDQPGGKVYRVAVLRCEWPEGDRRRGSLMHLYRARIIHKSIRHFPARYPYWTRDKRPKESYVCGFLVVAADGPRAKRAAVRVVKNRRAWRLAGKIVRAAEGEASPHAPGEEEVQDA